MQLHMKHAPGRRAGSSWPVDASVGRWFNPRERGQPRMQRALGRPAQAETARSLTRIELFESLTEAEVQQLERRCLWQRWNAGEQIIDRETQSNDVYFVIRGRVRIIDYSQSGHREVVFDELRPGAVVGELAAIDGEPRSVNVVAVDETLTASLPADVFIGIVTAHPPV